MRGSRSSRRRPLLPAAIAALLLLLPLAARGQQLGPPIPLFPPAAGERPAGGEAITGERLMPPQGGWSGEVTPQGEGLPRDFWRGTSRALADSLLARLPETQSPAVQSLLRRLLLSTAAAPIGPDLPGRRLPVLRATWLLRLGEIDAAREVIRAMPPGDRDAALPLAVAADAIAGKVDRACAAVRDAIRRSQELAWQRAQIACQALTGQVGEAELGLQLLAEQKAGSDETLVAAVDALARHVPPAAVVRLAAPDPLLLRLIVAAHLRLPPAVIATLRPDLALTLALDTAAPPATRLAAGERAARFGALTPEKLAALYLELAPRSAAEGGPAFADARDFAAAAAAESAADRLGAALRFADVFGAADRALAARLLRPVLDRIAPDPELAGAAPAAARLLLLAGDVDGARRWARRLIDPDGSRLAFLLRLAAAAETGPGPRELPPGLLPLALAAALGEPSRSGDWVRLPAAAWTDGWHSASPPALLLDLADAAAKKRIGETVLAAAILLGSPAAISTDPVLVHAAIAGLGAAGLAADARHIAIEVALAAGL
jgi:hypothetical protein